MAYRTVNEIEHFDFSNGQIFQISYFSGQMIFQLGYVTILGSNSCNRDIRDMGTNELTLKIQKVSQVKVILEGYKLYDADGNLKSSCQDEVIPEDRYKEVFQELENSVIYELDYKEGKYCFYIDTEERTYTIEVEGQDNIQEWERFMNKNPEY